MEDVCNIIISPKVLEKLAKKHQVNSREVRECFLNYEMRLFLKDNRDNHRTEPPTLWFIGETYRSRKLKIIFIAKKGKIHIKSAFDPNVEEKRIFDSHCRQCDREKLNG